MFECDIVILGGGISGLFLAHKILKSDPRKRITIIEKGANLGGRVETYKDKWMTVEAGAGRIHSGHRFTLNLIRELGLGEKLIPIDNSARFVDKSGELVPQPHIDVLRRVASKSKRTAKRELIEKSLLEYTEEVCGKESAKMALSSFGYTTEFLKMNAYDAIKLMGIIATPQKYFVLAGGLSQIIERLEDQLTKMGCRIERGREVVRIKELDQGVYKLFCCCGGEYVASSRLVCAIPAKDLARIQFAGTADFLAWTSAWKHDVKSAIYGGSLCRIYSQFSKPWFAGMGKLTTDSDLRHIIPIDEKSGVVMISYSDGAIANKWNRIQGTREVAKKLKELVESDLGVRIEMPKRTKVFYWSNGVGYWRVGADSAAIERCAIRGYQGLHFCGENFSSENQQWVEGALDTADRLFSSI
jgi:monoamine oxidase